MDFFSIKHRQTAIENVSSRVDVTVEHSTRTVWVCREECSSVRATVFLHICRVWLVSDGRRRWQDIVDQCVTFTAQCIPFIEFQLSLANGTCLWRSIFVDVNYVCQCSKGILELLEAHSNVAVHRWVWVERSSTKKHQCPLHIVSNQISSQLMVRLLCLDILVELQTSYSSVLINLYRTINGELTLCYINLGTVQ